MRRLALRACIATALALALPPVVRAEESPAERPAIETGSRVSLEYTVRDEAGELIDSNRGQAPLTFTQGAHEVVPGLENGVAGLRAGDERRITVAPADGYGEVDPSAVAEVPKDLIPAEARTVGTRLVARSADGRRRLVRVKEVREDTVVIDLNHPLAGKTLHFDVRVISVEPPAR